MPLSFLEKLENRVTKPKCIHSDIDHECKLLTVTVAQINKNHKRANSSEVSTVRKRPVNSGGASQRLKDDLVCRPVGAPTFSGSQRFQELKLIERRMPQEIGPGRYDIDKSDNFVGNKRKNFCISKVMPLTFHSGTNVDGHSGLMFVGDMLQFDPEARKLSKKLKIFNKSKKTPILSDSLLGASQRVQQRVSGQQEMQRVKSKGRDSIIDISQQAFDEATTQQTRAQTILSPHQISLQPEIIFDITNLKPKNPTQLQKDKSPASIQLLISSEEQISQIDTKGQLIKQLSHTLKVQHKRTQSAFAGRMNARNNRNTLQQMSVRNFLHQKSSKIRSIINSQVRMLHQSDQSTISQQHEETLNTELSRLRLKNAIPQKLKHSVHLNENSIDMMTAESPFPYADQDRQINGENQQTKDIRRDLSFSSTGKASSGQAYYKKHFRKLCDLPTHDQKGSIIPRFL
ncbi:hypothetical protein FGO68_gene1535 [Halteria grandinella]|uniref:Uncharacterized protein n=1 Tax=Halteria grandinella TaxID=5974 RepID=A0A8J8NH33_HALGN|nr:hypothetical protein FGO68_gene1535 [Halteria grandinella]